jgi:hypothetical protein
MKIYKHLLGLLLLVISILQGSAQTFDPAKFYQIANKVSNKVLEVKDASNTEGAQIFQWTAVTGKANQLWQIKKRADGNYNFISKSSGKLMDADNCTEGAIIKQYAADGTNSQNWKLIAQTDGSYKILNQTCNKYIRLESGSSADGASVGVKNDFGTDAFKWIIGEAATKQGRISGTVFEDKNNNGVYDTGEAPLKGVKIVLALERGNQNVDFVTTETLTDSQGNYVFTNLPPAQYITNAAPYFGNLILRNFRATGGGGD